MIIVWRRPGRLASGSLPGADMGVWRAPITPPYSGPTQFNSHAALNGIDDYRSIAVRNGLDPYRSTAEPV